MLLVNELLHLDKHENLATGYR